MLLWSTSKFLFIKYILCAWIDWQIDSLLFIQSINKLFGNKSKCYKTVQKCKHFHWKGSGRSTRLRFMPVLNIIALEKKKTQKTLKKTILKKTSTMTLIFFSLVTLKYLFFRIFWKLTNNYILVSPCPTIEKDLVFIYLLACRLINLVTCLRSYWDSCNVKIFVPNSALFVQVCAIEIAVCVAVIHEILISDDNLIWPELFTFVTIDFTTHWHIFWPKIMTSMVSGR